MHADVEQLILRIHSATLSPDDWTPVGEELNRVLSADCALMLRPGSRDVVPWTRSFGFDPAAIEAYAREWGTQDVWFQGAIRTKRVRTGLVSLDLQLVRRREYLASPYFNDFLRHFNIDRMVNLCLAGTAPNGHGPAAISFYRGLGREVFSEEDLRLLSVLAPHLVLATQTHWTLQSLGLIEGAYRQALDGVNAGVFIVDSTGRVLRANCMGEQLVGAGKWLRVTDGRLCPQKDLEEARALTAALARATAGLTFRLTATEPAGQSQAIVQGVPLSVLRDLPSLGHAAALVWVIPLEPTVSPVADLARLFDLSPAEERLLSRLVLIDDLRDVAAELRISIHTARSQLKSVFRKTGRRSQAQLLVLAARMASIRSS